MTRMYYPVCRSRLGHAVVRTAVAGIRRFGALRAPRLPFDALFLRHEAYAGLTSLWSRIHWAAGDGMMPTDELLTIYRFATDWPVEGDVIELGAWIGLTTSYLATACNVRGDGNVWAVDTFAGDREGDGRYPTIDQRGGSTLPEFQQRIQRAGVGNRVHTLQGRTEDMADVYNGRPARVLLIDADHSFDGVRSDFNLWLHHVAPGGLVIFHDYKFPGVRRFINDTIRHDDRIDFKPGVVLPNVVAVTKRFSSTGPQS